jgi:hypothetical protein
VISLTCAIRRFRYSPDEDGHSRYDPRRSVHNRDTSWEIWSRVAQNRRRPGPVSRSPWLLRMSFICPRLGEEADISQAEPWFILDWDSVATRLRHEGGDCATSSTSSSSRAVASGDTFVMAKCALSSCGCRRAESHSILDRAFSGHMLLKAVSTVALDKVSGHHLAQICDSDDLAVVSSTMKGSDCGTLERWKSFGRGMRRLGPILLDWRWPPRRVVWIFGIGCPWLCTDRFDNLSLG